MTKLARIEGYVWCNKLGEVHADTLDPYDYADPLVLDSENEDLCKPSDHRAVYARQE